MPFAAALSTATTTAKALDDVCSQATRQLNQTPDLAFVFFSPRHAEQAEKVAASLNRQLRPRCLIGCVGESIVGNDQEIEHRPALSLWLAAWSQKVELDPFHLVLEHTPDGPSLLGWPDSLIGADPQKSAVLLVGDPFTFPVDILLKQANVDYKGLRVMGGMASGIRGPGQCRLILNEQVFSDGAIGVLLQGAPLLRSIVSQGCRPIGKHMIITGGHDNMIMELGGRPPLAQLQEIWQQLNPRDQQLFQQGLHVGVVMNEYQGEFNRGDFLVRNVYGLEKETGALALTDHIRIGQTIQFHIRDADTADEDLRVLLEQDLSSHPEKPAAALLFTCNGRGSRLFQAPNHDASAIRRAAGNLPIAGFFAQGELGPIGGQNFIHGFTASVVLFEE
jgi:small ligand-binding sensory domain FIST